MFLVLVWTKYDAKKCSGPDFIGTMYPYRESRHDAGCSESHGSCWPCRVSIIFSYQLMNDTAS